MVKHKKDKKTLDRIGKEYYDFDFRLEKVIYCYLCCKYVGKKKMQKLDKKFRFETYQQWERYIRNKYKNFNKDFLSEFSRYLNQRIRNIRPNHEYWNIIAASVITLTLTKGMDMVLSIQKDFEGVQKFVAGFIIEFILILLILFSVFQTFQPLVDNNVDENLLKDYKEIIDDLITVK